MFDLSMLSWGTVLVLISVLVAEASNGWTDAPCSTSAAVASGVLSSRQALWVTVAGNFAGLMAATIVGAAVAKTIGNGIIRQDLISVNSIAIAMITIIGWAAFAGWIGLPVSKTHSLLAALAGIGYAQSGFTALLPASGHWYDSGWVKVAEGMGIAIFLGYTVSWFISYVFVNTGLSEKIPEHWWRRAQLVTVCGVSSGHGFNDGLKYVGIFTMVLQMSGAIKTFTVLPEVIVLCALVMGFGTMLGGWRIHKRLDSMVNPATAEKPAKKTFKPFMGVAAELTSAFFLWQTGWLGMPTSTNHATVSSMTGAKFAVGKVGTRAMVQIISGWIVTYVFCFFIAKWATQYVLM